MCKEGRRGRLNRLVCCPKKEAQGDSFAGNIRKNVGNATRVPSYLVPARKAADDTGTNGLIYGGGGTRVFIAPYLPYSMFPLFPCLCLLYL